MSYFEYVKQTATQLLQCHKIKKIETQRHLIICEGCACAFKGIVSCTFSDLIERRHQANEVCTLTYTIPYLARNFCLLQNYSCYFDQ